jgi:ribosomal protein S18 acetylase RimI-like enzyme
MISISTRLATLKDVAAVAKLFDAYRQFYEQPSDLQLAIGFIQERLKNDESVIIVAECKGRMIGFCQLYPTFCSISAARIFVLYDLFVLPDARNSGVATSLMLAAEQHATLSGFVRLDLTTAKTNIPAQSLYESLGWIRDDVYFAYSKFLRSNP